MKEAIPSIDGVMASTKAILNPENADGANFTDKLGLAGICLVFPEFEKIRPELLRLITMAHSIDHYVDEVYNDSSKRESIQNFNSLFTEFIKDNFSKNDTSELLKNSMGFIEQGFVVEKYARSLENPASEEEKRYRELINAVWTRMVVSYGSGLLHGQLDDISQIKGDFNHINEIYKPYINGTSLDEVPYGLKNRALYLWTMSIQAVYDKEWEKPNNARGVLTLNNCTNSYDTQAIEAGINPLALKTSKTAVTGVIRFVKLKSKAKKI